MQSSTLPFSQCWEESWNALKQYWARLTIFYYDWTIPANVTSHFRAQYGRIYSARMCSKQS